MLGDSVEEWEIQVQWEIQGQCGKFSKILKIIAIISTIL